MKNPEHVHEWRPSWLGLICDPGADGWFIVHWYCADDVCDEMGMTMEEAEEA